MLYQHLLNIRIPTQSNSSRETYAFKVCVNSQWFFFKISFLIDKTVNSIQRHTFIIKNYRKQFKYLTICSSFIRLSVYVYVFLFIIHVLERRKKGNMPTQEIAS